METDGFNKSIYQHLTTSELTTGLPLNVYKLLFKISFPIEKMNGIFISGTHLLHSISFVR